MRLITEKICIAFEQRKELKIDNSYTDGDSLYLFGNKIAAWRNGMIWISNAGYETKTTKERLNGITGVSIAQHRGVWYLNGAEWDGSWVNVSNFGNNEGIEPQEQALEIEFDMTLEWIEAGGYNKPIYSVTHKGRQADLLADEMLLNANNIPFKIIDTDTAGKYKPNYFIVVRADDYQKTLQILN